MTNVDNVDLSTLSVAELTRLIRERIDANAGADGVPRLLREVAARDAVEWWESFGTVRDLMNLAASTIEGVHEELAYATGARP